MEKFAKRPISYDQDDVKYLTSLGFDVEFAQLLNFRGVTIENAKEYFDDSYFFMHNPLLMSNMDKAVELVANAIGNNKKILIYGDYDADGLTATAILKLFFCQKGINVDYIIPTREEGYGLHVDLVVDRYEQSPFDILITVDCGISNKEEIKEIEQRTGITVLVTDHHELPEVLPDCVCINCKMGYPFAYLSGAGVALKLVEALSDRQTALLYSDLASVGTIADMMPLQNENRQIVKYGLKNIRHRGLLKLSETTKCDKIITASNMALKICPKINSAGRVGDPYKALDLLLMSEKATQGAVNELIECNTMRQNLLEAVIVDANRQLADIDFSKEKMLFLAGEDWPKGILGIGANRFKENLKMPVAFLAKEGNEFIGSARAGDEINLHELFSAVSDLLVRFGGHKGSVGFSVLQSNLPELKKRINSLLSNLKVKPIQTYYDLHFTRDWLEQSNFDNLAYLEPYLPNDRPVFYVEDFCVVAGTFGNGNLKFTLNCGLEIKAFGASFIQYLRALKSGAECKVCFYLERDKYTNKLFGSLVDIELTNSLKFDDLYACNFLARIDNNKRSLNKIDIMQAKEIICDNRNVLVVFNNYLDFEYANKFFDFEEFVLEFFCQKNYSDKVILISPERLDSLSRYKNVLIFANNDGFNLFFENDYFYVNFDLPRPTYLNDINIDRKICAEVYNAITVCNVKNYTLHDFFDSQFFYCNRKQFFMAIAVFKELGLVELEKDKIIRVNFEKKNLTDSKLFNMFSKKI